MTENKTIIGLTEKINVFGLKEISKSIIARIDTGATISSIDSKLASTLKLGPVIRTKMVKSAHGNRSRPIVPARIIIKDKEIKISLGKYDNKTILKISDNAGGIKNDVLPKVFDPYFTTKEQGKGTGVGLYMSKTIVEKNMNGKLTCKNIAGGAEFKIVI